VVQELHAATLQNALHGLNVLRPPGDWTGTRSLHTSNGIDVHACNVCHILLLYADECASCLQLIAGGKHFYLQNYDF
jgi:hypothetical protein